MKTVRIALAQMNATVGDLEGNAEKIVANIVKARQAGADVVVFPELAVSGYPPEDLLLKPAFIRGCRATLDRIAAQTRGIVAIVGFPEEADDLYNAAAVISDGKLVGTYRKQFLPNYGVFDEDRYFASGGTNRVFGLADQTFGVSICEDIWYSGGTPDEQATLGGAQLLINISASPYYAGKAGVRERMLAQRAADNVAAVAFCNLVGGQDELVFDGASAVFDATGRVIARGAQFAEDLVIADIDLEQVFRQRLHDPRRRKERARHADAALPRDVVPAPAVSAKPAIETPKRTPLARNEEVYQALVLGTRDYVHKNGFKKVVIGLSGGIDSSLVAAVAVDALGAENVVGVSMPSQYSSDHSRSDAAELAKRLNIEYHTVPIERAFRAYVEELEPVFRGTTPNVAEENLQARVRGNILMALSNKFNWLVLTTGNKSENSVGYCTLYGDMAGGFAVIKDVPKLLVFELCRHRNTKGVVIPENVLVKPPSAELRPDQTDEQSLGPYEQLDPVLEAYVERDADLASIAAAGNDPKYVQRIVRLVDLAEYKRRQAAPGVKITTRAFGKDRRLPITNKFREKIE